MADVNQMFDDVTSEQSFYIPGKEKPRKKDYKPFARGEYVGHIIECESKVVDVKGGKHKARLYTYVFQASEENKDRDFQFKNKNNEMEMTKGDSYVGCKFRGKVWRFLEPGKDDTFESNPEGNGTYLKFCNTIGMDCPVEKREIGGEEIEGQLLPNLSASDMLGKPVTAFVDLGRPWTSKDGERKQYWDAKYVKKWDEGKVRTITGDGNEIPF